MAGRSSQPPAARYLESRIQQEGFRPRYAAALIAGVWLVAIVVFGVVEHLVDPDTFENVWLGFWWATQTVTTVGYGDTVPKETAGQVIAVILMVGGLSLFAVVTGTITTVFVTRAQAQATRSEGESLATKVDGLASELEAIRERLDRLTRDDRPPPDTRATEGDV